MSGIKFAVEIPIEFEDLDAGGVVHHPNYLKICERARNRWLAKRGIDFLSLKNQDIALAVRSVKADYLWPIVEGTSKVEIEYVKHSSRTITVRHTIYFFGGPYAKSDQPAFRAEIVFVTANYSTGRSCLLPQSLLDLIQDEINDI